MLPERPEPFVLHQLMHECVEELRSDGEDVILRTGQTALCCEETSEDPSLLVVPLVIASGDGFRMLPNVSQGGQGCEVFLNGSLRASSHDRLLAATHSAWVGHPGGLPRNLFEELSCGGGVGH